MWRLEYTLLVGVALLMTAFAVAFFYFGADTSNLKAWGYAATPLRTSIDTRPVSTMAETRVSVSSNQPS